MSLIREIRPQVINIRENKELHQAPGRQLLDLLYDFPRQDYFFWTWDHRWQLFFLAIQPISRGIINRVTD